MIIIKKDDIDTRANHSAEDGDEGVDGGVLEVPKPSTTSLTLFVWLNWLP